jgi:hypothetical protein
MSEKSTLRDIAILRRLAVDARQAILDGDPNVAVDILTWLDAEAGNSIVDHTETYATYQFALQDAQPRIERIRGYVERGADDLRGTKVAAAEDDSESRAVGTILGVASRDTHGQPESLRVLWDSGKVTVTYFDELTPIRA